MSEESLRLEIEVLQRRLAKAELRWAELKTWIGTESQDRWNNGGESAEATGMFDVLDKMEKLENPEKWRVVWIQLDYEGVKQKMSETFGSSKDAYDFVDGLRDCATYIGKYLKIESIGLVI
jgi:hypothetical protein